MNSRILNKVVVQSLRHSQCRYLSVQQNINKCSSTYHTVNFHKRKENRSSSFIFTKFSNDRTLCQSTLPIYTCFQRNLSGTSQLSQAASVEQLTKAANVAPPTEEIIQNTGFTKWLNPEAADNVLIEYVQQVLMQMHESTGLPWWASIALTAFVLRTTIVLPFAISQLRFMAKIEKVNLIMNTIDKKLKRETIKAQKEYGWPETLTQQKYEEVKNQSWTRLVNQENCNPVKTYFLVSVQLALWFTSSIATISLCDPRIVGPSIPQQLATGGFGWITDLTLVDPYLILPISIALLNLCIVEAHQSFKVIKTSKEEQWNNAYYRIVSLALLPLAAYMPAAVNIYWLSSAFYGLVQVFILNSSPVRRIFRVPMNDPKLEHPYRYFLESTKEKLRLGKRETAIATK